MNFTEYFAERVRGSIGDSGSTVYADNALVERAARDFGLVIAESKLYPGHRFMICPICGPNKDERIRCDKKKHDSHYEAFPRGGE